MSKFQGYVANVRVRYNIYTWFLIREGRSYRQIKVDIYELNSKLSTLLSDVRMPGIEEKREIDANIKILLMSAFEISYS